MKISGDNIVKCLQLNFLVSSAVFLLVEGCAAPKPLPKPDPLAGWHFCSSQDPAKLDKAIRTDYQDYIRHLPPEEMNFASYEHDFENGTGQHAVLIVIGLNGTWWNHVLIYDKANKRIKTIKYSDGHYRS
jgi:hypothetical protein